MRELRVYSVVVVVVSTSLSPLQSGVKSKDPADQVRWSGSGCDGPEDRRCGDSM